MINSRFTDLNTVQGASEACDQNVVNYIAGTNAACNAEMCQICKS